MEFNQEEHQEVVHELLDPAGTMLNRTSEEDLERNKSLSQFFELSFHPLDWG